MVLCARLQEIVVIFNRKRLKSCGPNHRYQTRFSNLGCPTTSPMILNQKKWLVGESVERGYMVKSKHAMLPSDLFDIQRWVKTQKFALRSLMFFCMTLNAVNRAMRFVGLQSKTFEDFTSLLLAPRLLPLAEAAADASSRYQHSGPPEMSQRLVPLLMNLLPIPRLKMNATPSSISAA
jgi:hypothetical protein